MPRYAYQDMIVAVPETGISGELPGAERVRDATTADIAAMASAGMGSERNYPRTGLSILHRKPAGVLACLRAGEQRRRAGRLSGFLGPSGHEHAWAQA